MVTIYLRINQLEKALEPNQADDLTDLEARFILLETMDEMHRAQVRSCRSTHEVLNRLEKLYADKSAANVFRMLYKFYHYKKLEADGIADHYSKLEEMRRALEISVRSRVKDCSR